MSEQGKVYALDLLPVDPLPGMEVIPGDFTENAVLDQLVSRIGSGETDLVMSDMAPNISGMKAVDQPRAMYLAELALDFAQTVLKPGGDFVAKVFQGQGFEEFMKLLKDSFAKVLVRKPKASRAESREVYLLARGFKGGK